MKVLIADDHALLRDGLRPFVSKISDDVTIFESCDYPSTHEILATETPDLVLLDLRMPGMDGTDGVLRLRRAFPEARIVIVTGWVTRSDVIEAMRLGVAGYLPKSLNGTAMLHALRLILCGVPYYPAEVLVADAAPAIAADQPGERSPLASLTRREYEILTQLVGGASNKEIAKVLGLTEITIKSHLRNVFRKIGATNRTQAVALALREGVKAAVNLPTPPKTGDGPTAYTM
ncbi:putative two-component DNA-binding response regulator (LuxR family) [uncultured Alphaproteobacteria bacterium]|uniref:Putative two-component DNA-binding response regulator (LuxR family) n=1 Tax=uncultured Alphaproteobacteria bacterium TaxID=91750 RepID=A0A212KIR1_9PROT|nr:putative two-component DNA-binding response regulator (LuxR family) [uncultured Alphaproteobacteria bacterium]